MLKRFLLDKKSLKELDIFTLVIFLLLVLVGLYSIYMATAIYVGYGGLKNQLVWVVLGICIIYVILLIDYEVIKELTPYVYGLFVFLLIITYFFGTRTNGAKAWLYLTPSIGLQPSEFGKLALAMLMAKTIEKYDGINNVRGFFMPMAYFVLMVGLIVPQPDMGMTIVCFFMALGIYYVAGINLKIIVGGFVTIFIGIFASIKYGILPSYMEERIMTYINPNVGDLSNAYHIKQALIAIGSGGVSGTGAKFGEAAKESFASIYVPERSTDSIFTIIGEKWGFIGCVLLLVLYMALIISFLRIAKQSKDLFGKLTIAGFSSILIYLVFQNIGMNIKLLPITGLTLPFVSYGGSSFLSLCIMVGVVLNIKMKQNKKTY